MSFVERLRERLWPLVSRRSWRLEREKALLSLRSGDDIPAHETPPEAPLSRRPEAGNGGQR